MIGFILFPLYGAAIACLILLNTFQDLSQRSRSARIGVVLSLSVMAFILPFALVTYRNAQAGILSAPASGQVDTQALVKNEGAVLRELWLREIIPPTWQPTCFSDPEYTASEEVMPNASSEEGDTMMASPTSVCGISDRIGTTNPQGYYATLTMVAASAITCAIVASFLSTPRKKSKKRA